MRSELITALQALTLTPFRVSTELPFESGNQPLYLKNLRTIYVDVEDVSQDPDPVPQTLQGQTQVLETRTVLGYVAHDAKTLPARFDTVQLALIEAIDDLAIAPATHRSATSSHQYEDDVIVFTFQWTTRELKFK